MDDMSKLGDRGGYRDLHLDETFDFNEEGRIVAETIKGANHRDIKVISAEVAPILEDFVQRARGWDVENNKDGIKQFIEETTDKLMLALQEFRDDTRLRGIVQAQLQNYSSIDLAYRQ